MICCKCETHAKRILALSVRQDALANQCGSNPAAAVMPPDVQERQAPGPGSPGKLVPAVRVNQLTGQFELWLGLSLNCPGAVDRKDADTEHDCGGNRWNSDPLSST